MDHPPIQRLSGLKVIGDIEEGSGSGFQAIGRDAQDPMPIGPPAIGNREGEVGSGSLAIGSTDETES
jgi:hypothetical protein